MTRRSHLYLVLALALSASLAGCTDGSDGSEGTTPRETEGPDGSDDLGPLADLVPGVTDVPLPAGTASTATGVVYDTTTGLPIAGAAVAAVCVRQALPEVVPGTATSDAAGRFSFASDTAAALVDCLSVRYEVTAAGHTLAVPLAAGPLLPAAQHIVHAGMMPLN